MKKKQDSISHSQRQFDLMKQDTQFFILDISYVIFKKTKPYCICPWSHTHKRTHIHLKNFKYTHQINIKDAHKWGRKEQGDRSDWHVTGKMEHHLYL